MGACIVGTAWRRQIALKSVGRHLDDVAENLAYLESGEVKDPLQAEAKIFIDSFRGTLVKCRAMPTKTDIEAWRAVDAAINLERASARLTAVFNSCGLGPAVRQFLYEAVYLQGVVETLIDIGSGGDSPTVRGREGANARHAKHRAMKDECLAWFAQNRGQFRNKDDAAIEATKRWPVEFSTVRNNWLKGQ